MIADIKISNVEFLPDFCVKAVLSNGHVVIYNLQPKLVTARFKGIDEWDRFNKGEVVDGSRIIWEDGIELSVDEILSNVIGS